MRKLSRKKPNREHMIENQAISLILYETIETTEAKAKEVKSYVERLIARHKDSDLATRRSAYSELFDKNASKKLLEELAPRYASRKSGFIRSYHLKNRNGDNAPMMRLELVDKKVFVNPEKAVETKIIEPKSKKNKDDKVVEEKADTKSKSKKVKENKDDQGK